MNKISRKLRDLFQGLIPLAKESFDPKRRTFLGGAAAAPVGIVTGADTNGKLPFPTELLSAGGELADWVKDGRAKAGDSASSQYVIKSQPNDRKNLSILNPISAPPSLT